MIKVGITGEMGSGKSYCAKIFESFGVPVFYTDDQSRILLNTNWDLKKEISEEFGNIYDSDGMILTTLLREMVFSPGSESRLLRLNQIVHPYVFKQYQKFCQQNSDATYTIAETAILFETNMHQMVDKIIYLCVDLDLRIDRTFKRSGFTRQEYLIRMKSQMDPSEKKMLSDYIIYNNLEDDVMSQIKKIHSDQLSQ